MQAADGISLREAGQL